MEAKTALVKAKALSLGQLVSAKARANVSSEGIKGGDACWLFTSVLGSPLKRISAKLVN